MTRLRTIHMGLMALLVSAIAVIPSLEAHAQIIHGQRPELMQGLTFLSWKVTGDDEFKIEEWHLPVMLRAGLAENVELAVSGALLNASGDLSPNDDAISGLTDSRVQLSASFMDDQVLVSGGASLPTGQSQLTTEQQALLFWLSSDFLSFPVRSPGEGLNIFGQVGTALPAGQWVVGASLALHLAGSYEPYDNGREYTPGSRIIGNIGTERIWPANHRLTCDLLVTYTTDDKLEGNAIFRDGVQFDTRVHGLLALGRGSVEGGFRYILRGKDRVKGTSEELVPEPDKRHGDEFRLYGVGRLPVSHAATLWISGDAKLLSANDYPAASPFFEDAARVTGFGGGVDFALSPRSRAGIGVRGWTGSSDGAMGLGQLDLSGFELMQHFIVTF